MELEALREAARELVERTCAAQKVAAKIADAQTVARVMALLRPYEASIKGAPASA